MKLIVDIPEDVYTRLFDNGIQDNEIAVDDVCEMARALRIGKSYEERPQGEWKIDSIGVYCSECRKHPDYSSDFCPLCGADMRGEVGNNGKAD